DKRVRLQRPSGPPIVHGPILVEIVIGLLDNRIDTIKSLEEITLACLVLPDKRRDLIGVDPTRINHIAEVRYLKPFEFHFSPPYLVKRLNKIGQLADLANGVLSTRLTPPPSAAPR